MDMVGSTRFYLRSLEPEFELYASPVNIDASAPATPVSAPSDASAELAEAIGLYYTQGMPDDVGSLKEGLIDDGEFLQQVDIVYGERMEMLDYALDRYVEKGDGGLLFFYFSTVDLTSHMMWRHSDEHHPHHDADLAATDSSEFARHEGATWATTIYDVIAKTDPALGRIREKLGEDATIVVMSDHGFAPYRWKFNLNAWLLEKGYLVLREGAAEQIAGAKISSVFDDGGVTRTVVDWSKTRAYGIGFNGLYLNLEDREQDDPRTEKRDEDEAASEYEERGIVKLADAPALLAEIKAELEAYEVEVVDPLTQERLRLRPVVRCDLTTEVYSAVEKKSGGLIRDGGPDIVVGYDSGWGNSDEATQGEIMARYVPPRGGEPGRVEGIVVQPNKGGTFNGSHLMVPDVVPGTLLSNRKVRPGDHQLEDLTVEVLRQYGIQPREHMTGNPVLE
jgi:predicted AlkP superfamily phosphohydrolase/phosphomutase